MIIGFTGCDCCIYRVKATLTMMTTTIRSKMITPVTMTIKMAALQDSILATAEWFTRDLDCD